MRGAILELRMAVQAMEVLSQAATVQDYRATDGNVMFKDCIRVLVVDDHEALRRGIVRMLQNQDDMSVVGEAADGNKATILARHLNPDVILMDFNMPGMNGAQATRVIHHELPDIQIIGLSMFEDIAHKHAMLDAGAVNCIVKGCDSEALLDAIRASGWAQRRRNLDFDEYHAKIAEVTCLVAEAAKVARQTLSIAANNPQETQSRLRDRLLEFSRQVREHGEALLQMRAARIARSMDRQAKLSWNAP